MNMEIIRKVLLGTLLTALATGPAVAAEQGPYLGFALSESDDDILNETDSGFKLFGGYTLSPNLGVELAFVDLGEFSSGNLEQDGLSVHLLGYLPVSQSFDLFGKVGFFNWEVRASGLTDTGTDISYGFGGEVRVSNQLAIRAEWETYDDVSGGDVDLFSLGLSLRF